MRIHSFLIALCILSLAALAAPAFVHAQSSERIADLEISVWPEFDDPRVLVQYDGNLGATDGYPRDVSFYIPASASLTATAYEDESQKLLNSDPPTLSEPKDGFKLVTFKLPKPHFHVEYYDDALKGNPDKTLAFAYRAKMPADQVRIEIQQPLKAENFRTMPAAALQSDGAHNFKYHIFNYPGVSADQALTINASYTKTDPSPSIQNVVAPDPGAQTAPSPANTETVGFGPEQTYFIAGAALLFAIGLLAVWMWYSRRQPRLVPAAASAARHKGAKAASGSGSYCGQCGLELRTGDNFCPRCGAKRR